MPLFAISQQALLPIEQTNVSTEKELQQLIERNLAAVFSCRLVASEFPTGVLHGGRIDTLALSEDDNPVIIEYKKVESSELINQSLFYLAWLNDHRGDFHVAAQQALGPNVNIDWSDIRVICLAPNFRKYDLHAVQVMGANIELWSYRLFKNSTLHLEEVFQKSYTPPVASCGAIKNPVQVLAGKKAAITKATATYTFEQHLAGKSSQIIELTRACQEFVLSLDPSIEEAPKKLYIAYKTSQNIVCVEVQRQRLVLFLKLDPTKVHGPPKISRDVSDIGHFGTGNLEISIKSVSDLDTAKPFIRMAYEKVGG